jgi:hypothetical protein
VVVGWDISMPHGGIPPRSVCSVRIGTFFLHACCVVAVAGGALLTNRLICNGCVLCCSLEENAGLLSNHEVLALASSEAERLTKKAGTGAPAPQNVMTCL